MKHWAFRIGVAVSVFCAGWCMALDTSDHDRDAARRLTNRTDVAMHTAAWQKAHKGNESIRIWPGVLADRDAGVVRFYAEATGIGHSTPVEFFLIGEASGHDYEALAIALARPADIREALLFIGMQAGAPVNPSAFGFWPKGERAHVTIGGVRAEELIMDERTGEPLRTTGLIFTGSTLLPDANHPGHSIPSAETHEPHAIAANYNESHSLFDVPWQATKNAVYAKQSANPKQLFPEGRLLPVEIRPSRVNGATRVRELQLNVSPGTGGITITEKDAAIPTDGSLNGALALFTALRNQGFDCYVRVRFDNALPLTQAQKLAGVLRAVDVDTGIRIGPPEAGRLFYRAYVPPAAYASRQGRTEQPWELRLSRSTSDTPSPLKGVLTQLAQTWDDTKQDYTVTAADYLVADGQELKRALARMGPGLPVIIVFVSPNAGATVGELSAFIQPALDTHPMMFVFTREPKQP